MTPPRLSRLLTSTRGRGYREKEGCAPSNPIVLVTLKEPSIYSRSTIPWNTVFCIFPKHRRPVLSPFSGRSMAIHNALALSGKREGATVTEQRSGRGEGGEKERTHRGRIFPATDVTMGKIILLSREREPLKRICPSRGVFSRRKTLPLWKFLSFLRDEETTIRRLALPLITKRDAN